MLEIIVPMKQQKHLGFFFFDLLKDGAYLSKWIVLLLEVFLSSVAFLVAYMICFSLLEQPVLLGPFFGKLLLNIFFSTAFFLIFKTYKGIIRHSTFRDLFRVALAVASSNLVMWLVNEVLHSIDGKMIFPNVGFFINFSVSLFLILSKKMSVKLVYDYIKSSARNKSHKSLFVYGITTADVEFARLVEKDSNNEYKLEGFISTSTSAVGKKLYDVPVYYADSQLEELLDRLHVQVLLINPLELERSEKGKIADACIRHNVELLSAPPVSEWREGASKKVKKIMIEELLGRIPIEIDVTSIGASLSGKCILITGAAGSIGSEIVRQISKFETRLLLLCDIAETPLHQLRLELEEKCPKLNFLPIVADVRNDKRMEGIFEKFRPQYVYHAAAYKHVPLMEEHPSEAVLTNVCGTKNMVDLSIRYQVESFVMISTDKAVNPSNVMGCSKRIAEIYVQSKAVEFGKNNQTRFITTRFGNVLGSNGSVIPRFKEQIAKGGPVTVTHKDIIRYFMTIPEACRLVLEAGNMGKGGEIYVFDMGDPVKIVDLAERMIRLAGYEPGKDIEIQFTGLRPGEKLYEELLNDQEQTKPTHNRKIKIGKIREYDNYEEIHAVISDLIHLSLTSDTLGAVKLMKVLVPEFISKNSEYEVLDPGTNGHAIPKGKQTETLTH